MIFFSEFSLLIPAFTSGMNTACIVKSYMCSAADIHRMYVLYYIANNFVRPYTICTDRCV